MNSEFEKLCHDIRLLINISLVLGVLYFFARIYFINSKLEVVTIKPDNCSLIEYVNSENNSYVAECDGKCYIVSMPNIGRHIPCPKINKVETIELCE